MKILHVCLSNFYIDDYSYQENMLTKFHVLHGHDVTVLASLVTFNKQGKNTHLPKESTYYVNDGYKVIRVNYKKKGIYNFNKRFRYYNNIYDKIVAEKPDIIFIHGCQFMDIKHIKRYVLHNDNVKVFVDNHADFINSATNWLSKNILHKMFWRYCAKIIEPITEIFYGVTPNRCVFLEEVYKIPRSKIKLLVMGVDDKLVNHITSSRIDFKEYYRSELNLHKDDFVITTGGKIDCAKNIHLLMESVKELDNPRIKLLIFGNIAPEIKELFDSLNNHISIIHLGWRSHDDIIRLFLISDLTVFPGTHSVLWEEAVGCGIPSVFKYWEGMTHVDVGGNCVFLKEDSTKEIQRVVSNILENKEIYEKMLKSSLEKKDQFFYSNIAARAIE